MNSSPHPVSKFVSGHLALDFCNTAGEHVASHYDELLHDWETFIRWCRQAGLLVETSYRSLSRELFPMKPVIELRECIFRCGLALARHEQMPVKDLATLDNTAHSTLPPVIISRHAPHWAPQPEHASTQLRALLAVKAISLFCSPEAARIGVCEGGACGWLFLDNGRGKRRRWCDMKDCGSRAKAKTFYQRHKQD